ncbi:hypothetical protein AKJ09_08783 [Labilithrix luteola]|uniref:Uncharacterized protein n=1 Tax=Labilithrix luteola TaxID=1391654 RepID=A0A0K1Q9M7_9BACT|nr:hypothetical protein [Labilithrix luteola]AKV02120.1 hypothetical protein AKJ09_08783 [Labilithrix luteola]
MRVHSFVEFVPSPPSSTSPVTLPSGVTSPVESSVEDGSSRRLDDVGVESVLEAMMEARDRSRARAGEPELRPYNPLSVPTPVSIPFSRERLAFAIGADELDEPPRAARRKEPDSGSFLKTR